MPTLRERLGGWISGRAATEAMAFHPPYVGMFGTGIGNQPTHKTLLQENIGVPDMATRAIANRISTLNPQIKVTRRPEAGTEIKEILDDHPLKALLDKPHPDFMRSQLLRLTAQWIVTVGEAYWLKVGNGFGVPAELHPIPPAQCWPNFSRGVTTSYSLQDGYGKITSVPPDTVIRFFFPDPENPWGSEGYLGPSAITADSLKFSGEHLRRHYQHDATPKTALETTEAATQFSPDEKKNFLRRWVEAYHNRVGSSIGEPPILPLGYKLIQMALETGADIVPLLEFWSDEALMAYGVPKSILGKVVSGDRSSAETNQYVFDLHTITPVATLVAGSLTDQLAPDYDEKLVVEFEQFVSPDKEFQLQQEQSDLDRKVKTVDDVLEGRGEEASTWGALPVGQIGQIPYDGMGFDLAEDQADALGEDEGGEEEEGRSLEVVLVQYKRPHGKPESASAFSSRSAFFTPEAEWLRQIKREKKYVPTFRKEMLAIFAIQERSTLANLKLQEPRARIVADDVFDEAEWGRLFRLRVEPVREKAFLSTANESFAGLGVEAEFVMTDAMREVLEEQGAQLIKHANATTKMLISRQLQAATIEGEGVDAMATRIRKAFRVRRHHARTIARTEVLKSSQTAQVESFEQSGVVEKKRWNTSMDAAVRDEHVSVEGQVVGLRSAFTLGNGEQADAPGIGLGGTTLSAGNSINCRCFVTPVLEG